MTNLSIIAGLGNPEDKYEKTLHNAGFWFVDALARKHGGDFRYEKKFDAECCRIRIGDQEVWLVKPQSYMNLSGGPVRGVMDYYRLETPQLLVAHDEIDLPPGTVRLKLGGGHGGHNGIRDVIRHCGADFMQGQKRLGICLLSQCAKEIRLNVPVRLNSQGEIYYEPFYTVTPFNLLSARQSEPG